uniref:Uncharacterized protein n=1 Tax=Vespula pensylvanica TaxID=30213 RepID=A0A834P7A1_VESPE|nr:hypothetical protein H0235_004437 [Vespula pensylvanica]
MPEVLHEVFPLPLVGDGVLVEDLGHDHGYDDGGRVKRRFGWARMGAHLRDDERPGVVTMSVVGAGAGGGGGGGVGVATAAAIAVALAGAKPKS